MEQEDHNQKAARAHVLIDLTGNNKGAAAAKSPNSVASIDLTRDSSYINLIDDTSGNTRKRRRRDNDNWGIRRERKKRAARKQAPVDCSICLESVEPFQGYSLTTCNHSFCKPCLHHYVQTKLSDKEVRQLTCPDTTCRVSLDPIDVRSCTLEVGDASTWRSYQEIATESFLDTAVASKDASTRRCPTNHCNFTFQYEASEDDNQQGQLFICPECEEAYCLQCPVVQGKVGPAHDDTCYNVLEQVQKSEERQRKLEEWKRDNSQADSRFQELLRREGASGKTMPCPNCKTPITKNGGCSHMHCTSCQKDFTWSSKGSWW